MTLEKDLDRCSPIELAALLSGESMWTTREITRAAVPRMVFSDGPHGVRCCLGQASDLPGGNRAKEATCFPCGVNLAMSWNTKLMEKVGAAMGEQAKALGINVLLGPAVNIQRNPLCGRNFEYLSEDPQVAGRIGAGLVRGIQSQGIGACVKHFAGNSQELRRQASNSVIDERTLRELYLTAFELVVRTADPSAIMSSYNQVNGIYTHENRHLLTDILRNEWGFDGFVMSDWGGSNTAVGAVLAGGSLEMPSPGLTSLRELEQAFRDGTITVDDLKDRALEIAKVARETYFDVPGDEPDLLSRKKKLRISDDMLSKGHDLAYEAATETLTLLKNDNSVLPLRSGCRVAVVGNLADRARFQGGGSSEVTTYRADSLLEALRALSDDSSRETSDETSRETTVHSGATEPHTAQSSSTAQPSSTDSAPSDTPAPITVTAFANGYLRSGRPDTAELRKALALAKRDDVDVVLAVVGLTEAEESEGVDRTTMSLPAVQNSLMKSLIAECKRNGKPLVAVLVSGSPVELPWADSVDAILYTGLAGEASGAATAAVLTGAVNPSGHLAQTWPLTYADCPAAAWFPAAGPTSVYVEGPFVGYRYFDTASRPVRFPFGHGLSYSHFTFSNLEVNQWGVACTVSNDSSVDGSTVVQLYVSSPTDGAPHVSRELKGFAKVTVPAGGSQEVRIGFDEMTFRHFEPEDNQWHVTSGAWTIWVGDSSADLPLTSLVHIHGDMPPKATSTALGALSYADVHHATAEDIRAMFAMAHTAVPENALEQVCQGNRIGKPKAVEHDPQPFGPNVPISSWTQSSGHAARSVAAKLTRQAHTLNKETGAVDMNAYYILDMPPRGMQKIAGGRVDRAMVEDIVDFGNGHTFHAARNLIKHAMANIRANHKASATLRRARRK